VNKLDDEKETYKRLPNVVKDYFRNHPNQEMPSKFKKKKKKSKKKDKDKDKED